MIVVADSGALYALYDGDDANHIDVTKIVRRLKSSLIVPVAILAELDYLLREFLGINAELDFLEGVSKGFYILEQFTEADLSRSQEVLSLYRDLNVGLADAAVIVTAERLNARHILTVDERHFRAIKPRKGVFTLLPKDAQ